MIKIKNSVQNLVEIAKIQINKIEIKKAIIINSNERNFFTYIREIKKSRCMLSAKHVPRSKLEFWVNPNSSYHKEFFNEDFNFIFYCASDWCYALAKLTANYIGLLNTSYFIGNYNRCLELESPIEEARLFHKTTL